MIKRHTLFSIRMPFDLIDKLEAKVKENKFKSISDAVRQYVQVGIHVESIKSKIKDPDFIKSVEHLKQEDNLIHWAKNLKDNEIDAISLTIQTEKENRYAK